MRPTQRSTRRHEQFLVLHVRRVGARLSVAALYQFLIEHSIAVRMEQPDIAKQPVVLVRAAHVLLELDTAAGWVNQFLSLGRGLGTVAHHRLPRVLGLRRIYSDDSDRLGWSTADRDLDGVTVHDLNDLSIDEPWLTDGAWGRCER